MPDRLRAAIRATLSLALDVALWLVNVQMLAIGLLGKAVRRLSETVTLP